MCCKIHGHTADECHSLSNVDEFDERSGVYVILGRPVGNETSDKTVSYNDEEWRVLDVGESGNISSRLKNHDREECWKDECSTISVAAIYVDGSDARTDMQDKLRGHYNPPCGDK